MPPFDCGGFTSVVFFSKAPGFGRCCGDFLKGLGHPKAKSPAIFCAVNGVGCICFCEDSVGFAKTKSALLD